MEEQKRFHKPSTHTRKESPKPKIGIEIVEQYPAFRIAPSPSANAFAFLLPSKREMGRDGESSSVLFFERLFRRLTRSSEQSTETEACFDCYMLQYCGIVRDESRYSGITHASPKAL